MNALLPFVILGITAGSVYGLTGTGLVLTYKTSGIFNFAQGAVATTGAYVFYILHDDLLHLPAVPTALICVFVVGPVLGLGLEAMARRLADASATMKVVATVGIVLAVQGFFAATFGTLARTFPAWLPQPHGKHRRGVRWRRPNDHYGHRAGRDRGAVPLLPAGPAWARHAWCGGQPRTARPRGHQPGSGAAVGMDHRVQLRHAGGHPAGPHPQPGRHRADPAGRPGLRRRGDRPVLQPAADLRGRPGRRRRSRGRDQVRRHQQRRAGRAARQHPVHRALPGAHLHPAVQARRTPGGPAPARGGVCGARPGAAGWRHRAGGRPAGGPAPGQRRPAPLLVGRADPGHSVPLAGLAGPHVRAGVRCARPRSPPSARPPWDT